VLILTRLPLTRRQHTITFTVEAVRSHRTTSDHDDLTNPPFRHRTQSEAHPMTTSITRNTAEQRFRCLVHATGVAVTVTVVLLIIELGVLPTRAQQRSVETEFAAIRDFLARADEVNAHHQQLRRQLELTEQQFAEAVTRIPETAQESEFLAQVSELARHTKLTIQEFRTGSVTEHATHRELEISLAASGPYRSLCEFLGGLDRLSRLCRVQSLTVDRSADQESGNYPVRMSVVVFFQPLPPDSGDRINADA
jgi:Tfp pilus assembly protein PilO